MTHEAIKKETRIERSRQRLSAAVQRLEAALDKNDPKALRGEMKDLSAENESLRQAAHGVSEKLDATIGRLSAILEDDQEG